MSYAQLLTRTAREVRIGNILGTNTDARTLEILGLVQTAADKAGIARVTAACEWVAEVHSPHPDDQELAELKAKWDAMQPAADTVEWYNKWFCNHTMDFGLWGNVHWYKAAFSQYQEWMDEVGDPDTELELLREQYMQNETDIAEYERKSLAEQPGSNGHTLATILAGGTR